MIRKIVAVVAGLAVAVVLVMLIQKLGHSLFPPPADLDPNDQKFIENYIATLPWGPLAFVVASYALSTLFGGWLAAHIAGEKPVLFASIVGLAVIAGATSTVLMIPHPSWFVAASVIGIVLAVAVAVGLAGKHGGRRKIL